MVLLVFLLFLQCYGKFYIFQYTYLAIFLKIITVVEILPLIFAVPRVSRYFFNNVINETFHEIRSRLFHKYFYEKCSMTIFLM